MKARGRASNGIDRRVEPMPPGNSENPRQLGALAVMHAQQGRLDHAVQLLHRALDRGPDIAELHNNLGMTLYSLQRTDEAVACYQKALALRPRYALAHNNLGVALAALGRHDEAIACYQEAMAIQTGYVEALNNLGTSLHAVDRSVEAVKRFGEALALRPDFIEARINLGHALSALGRAEEAIPCYEAALKVQPGKAITHVNLAGALLDAGRHAEAAEHYETAIALRPDLAAAHAGLGGVLLEIGRIDEARHCYERASAFEPQHPSHLLGLTRSIRLTSEDPFLGRILDMGKSIDSLEGGDRIDAHFALGKALADIGEHQQSFAHLVAGNSLRRRVVSYDEAGVLRQLERNAEVFTAELVRCRQNVGVPSALPIFIVGMPRSGSTLVEQMLASHGQVLGAGEVPAFADALRASGLQTPARPFPDSVPDWTADQLRHAAEEYLRRLELARSSSVTSAGSTSSKRAPADQLPLSASRHGVERITDKMLANFRYVGLIHLMLPNARIIHTRRDPVDTCLSCFSIQFAKVPYSFDLGEMGRFYKAYADLMEHWRTVLPPGRILDVQYEDLVRDFETTARRILTHCGLGWDDACLRYYETQRPVRTSSVTQVREPIYQHAIGRWRPDADLLRPLMDGLGIDSDRAVRVDKTTQKILRS